MHKNVRKYQKKIYYIFIIYLYYVIYIEKRKVY